MTGSHPWLSVQMYPKHPHSKLLSPLFASDLLLSFFPPPFRFSPQEPGEVRPPCFLPWVRWVGAKAGKHSSPFQALKQNKRLRLSSLFRHLGDIWIADLWWGEISAVSLCLHEESIPEHIRSYCFGGKHSALWAQISVFSIIDPKIPQTRYLETIVARWILEIITTVLPSQHGDLHKRPLGNWNLSIVSLSLSHFLCDPQMAENLMAIAYENGVNLFDTAEVYASGRSDFTFPSKHWLKRLLLVLSSRRFFISSFEVFFLCATMNNLYRFLDDTSL